MWTTLWHRGLLSLMLTLATACGLLVAPTEQTESLRGTLRDGVAPGANGLALLQEWTGHQQVAAREAVSEITARTMRRSDDFDRIETLRDERDAAVAARHQLEAQLARARAELEEMQSLEGQYLRRDASRPLVQTAAVPARVIGSDRGSAVRLADRLIDVGGGAGLATGDFVMDASHSPSSPDSSQVLIDQGTNAALQPDWPVTSRGVLVGRIRQCGEWTSTVQLVSDPEFRVGARLVRTTSDGPVFGAAGLFAGRGDLAGEMNLVPSTEPVTVGDRVYTQETIAGAELLLLIGSVAAADVPEGEPHWRITVVPAAPDPGLRVDVLKIELNRQRLAAQRPATSECNHRGTP